MQKAELQNLSTSNQKTQERFNHTNTLKFKYIIPPIITDKMDDLGDAVDALEEWNKSSSERESELKQLKKDIQNTFNELDYWERKTQESENTYFVAA